MLRNIIWDVDGTLIDSYPAIAHAFKAALNDFGHDSSVQRIEELAKQSLRYCTSTLADQYQLNVDVLGQRFDAHYNRVTAEEQPPFPGVSAVCEYICAIGGKNVIVTHRGREGTAALLVAHRLTRYFSGCLTRDDAFPRKPDPAAFVAILNAHHLKRDETMTIGDRDIDMIAGRAAGVFTCFFRVGTAHVVSDLTVSDFSVLLGYLKAQNEPLPHL